MKLRSVHIAVLTLVVMFGGIGLSMLAGLWQSESSKVPATYTSGEFAGEANPADIRGSYSFADVAAAFDVPAEVLVEAFGFGAAENAEDLQIKLFEDVYGVVEGKEIGTDSMRLFVALYLGRPYTPEEDTGLPAQALHILEEAGRLEPGRASEFRAMYAVELTGLSGPADGLSGPAGAAEPADADDDSQTGVAAEGGAEGASAADLIAAAEAAAKEEAEAESEDTAIKGKTTFRDLMDWGLTAAEIEEIISMPLGPPTQALRDFFLEQGMEFSTYKDALQERIDQKRE